MESFHSKLRLLCARSIALFLPYALLLLLMASNSVAFANSNDEKQLVESAKHTLENFMNDTRLSWFENNINPIVLDTVKVPSIA